MGYISIHMFPKASRIVKDKKVFYYREKDFEGLTGIKYYKGLGTFRNEDSEEFFNNPKIITLVPTEEDKKWMTMALGSGESDKRKNWISQYIDRKISGEIFEEIFEGKLEIPRFIKENLSVYFREALYRAVPSMVDGLKEGQRKCIHSLLKRNVYMNEKRTTGSQKVIALQGSTLQESEYHHGDTALQGTYVHLAVGYTGTNNIPWLFNDGQFGTRHGDAAAAARYIETAIDPIMKHMINAKDLPICNYKKGEKKMIEPEWYPTLLPMLLVNGTSGIAVGYATDVPSFNPLDLIEEIKSFLDGDEICDDLTPWYRGYTGEIEKNGKTWKTTGSINEVTKGVFHISELPLSGKYTKTQNYKQFLWNWKKTRKGIKKINENHSVNKVQFEIISDGRDDLDLDTKEFHLSANLKFNMWVVDPEGRPKYYTEVKNYLEDWCIHRLKVYELRKTYWLNRLKFEKEVAKEQVRYLKQILNDEIVAKGKKKKQLMDELSKNNYKMCNLKKFVWKTTAEEEDENVVDEEEEDGEGEKWSMTYLSKIGIWDQTTDQVEKFEQDAAKKQNEYTSLKKKKIEEMWLEELEAFEKEYPTFMEIRNKSDGKKQKIKKKK